MTTPDATPTAPHSDAQPVSAPEPSGSTPEAGEGAHECDGDCQATAQWRMEKMRELRRNVSVLMESLERVAAEREAFKDERNAARAEVERLTDELDRERLSQDYKPEGVDVVMGKMQDARRRAEAAEAESARLASVVAKVKAIIADPDFANGHVSVVRLAAALASVAPDTATPGEAGCRGEGETCLTHGGGWIFNDDGTADVCESADLYPAASSADDKAGE